MTKFSIGFVFALVTILMLAVSANSSLAQAKAPSKRHVNVLEAGATGDGKTKDTQAVQAAIDKVAEAGGGTVVFPPGDYLVGGLDLRSHVTLEVQGGATIIGSPNMADYPVRGQAMSTTQPTNWSYPRCALIYARDVEDVSIVGNGTINGQGKSPEFNEWRKFKGKEKSDMLSLRPYLLVFAHCRGVRVQELTLRDAAFWTQDYADCDDVTIRGLTVSGHANGNNDGIDVDGCRNVRISDCNVDSGDDALCLKAAHRDCENVAVNNCILKSSCNALKFGTASASGFKNITISNCVIRDTLMAGLALEIVDGGTLDGVSVSGITMNNVATPIYLRLGDRATPWTKGAAAPPVGQYRNVTLSNIVASTRVPDERDPAGKIPVCSSISGVPGHPIENVTLSDIRITFRSGCTTEQQIDAAKVPEEEKGYPDFHHFGALPAYGFYFRHVTGLTLRNVDVTYALPDVRPAIVCDDVKDLRIDSLRAMSEGTSPVIDLRSVESAAIFNSVAPVGAKSFLSAQGESKRISLFNNDLRGAAVQADSAGVSTEQLKQHNRMD